MNPNALQLALNNFSRLIGNSGIAQFWNTYMRQVNDRKQTPVAYHRNYRIFPLFFWSDIHEEIEERWIFFMAYRRTPACFIQHYFYRNRSICRNIIVESFVPPGI